MVFFKKFLGGTIFIVITVPAAWTALLLDHSSPVAFTFVVVGSFLVARALWKATPDSSKSVVVEVREGPGSTATEFGSEYVPPGYAELGLDKRLADYGPDDCLGRAAEIGRASQEAMAAGNHDLVWRLVQMEKVLYMQHAAKSGFTRAQTLALDGGLHRVMAEVLRKEGKHRDALVNILYWASSYPKTARATEKLVRAYLNRAKVPSLRDNDVFLYLNAGLQNRELTEIQSQVARWYQVG
jgi:hypothetical protein